MIVVTTETVSGRRIVKTLGIVRGNTIRARHIGKDIKAVFRHIIGGEITALGVRTSPVKPNQEAVGSCSAAGACQAPYVNP